MRSHPRPRRLSVDPLEGRDVPAGNIHTFVADGTLFVVGDAQDNSLVVSQPAGPGTLTLSPTGGTTINGLPAPMTGTIPANVDIMLGAGNDSLSFDLATAPIAIAGSLVVGYGSGGTGTKTTQTTGATTNNLVVGGGLGIRYAAGTVTTILDNVRVGGSLAVVHGIGDSTFTLNNKAGDGIFSLVRGNLVVANTQGVATNTLADTNVGMSVAFGNGLARASDDAAGTTRIANVNNSSQAIIGGNLVIRNLSGDSATGDTVGDVHVRGSVAIGLGTGAIKATVAAQHVNSAPVINGSLGVGSAAAGSPTVDLGAAGTGLTVLGNLAVRGGNGGATVALNDVHVGGATGIATGSGGDSVSIDAASGAVGSVFHNFALGTGGGNDTVTIAGGSGTTFFRGSTAVSLGAGDDTLSLAPTGPVDFVNFGPVFNGGMGTNTDTVTTANLKGKAPVFENFS
jgi:hypothetical protein